MKAGDKVTCRVFEPGLPLKPGVTYTVETYETQHYGGEFRYEAQRYGGEFCYDAMAAVTLREIGGVFFASRFKISETPTIPYLFSAAFDSWEAAVEFQRASLQRCLADGRAVRACEIRPDAEWGAEGTNYRVTVRAFRKLG